MRNRSRYPQIACSLQFSGVNSAQKNLRKCIIIVTLVVGIVWCCIIAVILVPIITHVVQPAQQVTNTSIITTDKIAGLQLVWLANISTHWYTSFDVQLFANSTSLLPMPVYAVPVKKLTPKGLVTNLTCTCHEKSKQCDIKQLRSTPCTYNVAPIKEFLFAGFHFIYNVCVL